VKRYYITIGLLTSLILNVIGQSNTYTCPNGASVTVTINSFTDAGGGTQCAVNTTIESTIFNDLQRRNYIGVGWPSYNSTLFNANFSGPYPSTVANTGDIVLNLSCSNYFKRRGC